MPPPSSLPDELIEEVFLRLPPDEPACLVRASLASKPWLDLLSSPAFRGRYRDFHGAPPMLGFLYADTSDEHQGPASLLVANTSFLARFPTRDWEESGYFPLDCRHGRVVLEDMANLPLRLVIWDPMTAGWTELEPRQYYSDVVTVAVLCAVSGCDHRACHEGPFRVVTLGLLMDDVGECYVDVCEYLSETGEWTEQGSFDLMEKLSINLSADLSIEPMPPVLIADTLYFMIRDDHNNRVGILSYDLGSHWLSAIAAPPKGPVRKGKAILMVMEDGCLGFAHLKRFTLYLWSRQMSSDGIGTWARCRIIDLKEITPIQNTEKINLIKLLGSVERSDTIFVAADLGVYEINLEPLRWKKVWNDQKIHALIPYMSFYHPQERVNMLHGTRPHSSSRKITSMDVLGVS
ncbi:hypothetical protein VPH35_094388 [Triticum aestivum]